MPCYSMRTTTVELTDRNPNLMVSALKLMGLNATITNNVVSFNGVVENQQVTGQYAEGKLTHTGILPINEVKKAYAAATVEKTFAAAGWKLTKTATGYQAIKR